MFLHCSKSRNKRCFVSAHFWLCTKVTVVLRDSKFLARPAALKTWFPVFATTSTVRKALTVPETFLAVTMQMPATPPWTWAMRTSARSCTRGKQTVKYKYGVKLTSFSRGYSEGAATKSSEFYPISEETVFMDPPQNVPRITTSSPVDSWMGYSNSSSDEYSLSAQFNIGSSTEETSDCESTSPKKNKPDHYTDLQLEDEELTTTSSKRLRVKESHTTPTSSVLRPATSCLPPVDVRMIDFAHTTFAAKSGSSNAAPLTVHHGPDGGFLTGVDSLKRLLLQILSEG